MYKGNKLTRQLILLSICLIVGCGKAQSDNVIKGKFVFESNRSGGFGYPAHIYKDGKIKLLDYEIYRPTWSPDGRVIACSVGKNNKKYKKDGILLIDEQGKKIDFIETEEEPSSLSWFPSGDKIVYELESREWSKINTHNLKSKETKTIFKSDKMENIFYISISPKGDKIIFIKGYPEDSVYIVNTDGTNLKFIRKYIMPAWYPDGKHILFETNVGENGKLIGDPFKIPGYLFKMNVETGETERLRVTPRPMDSMKFSKDGKYFYYTTGYEGGEIIAISPADDFDKITYLTTPVAVRPSDYSQDRRPDWYQGE